MALATTCPQCKTSFKVVPDQLKLRRGLVRCGVCQHVFSGIDYLRYVDDAARAAQRLAREQAGASGADGTAGGTTDATPVRPEPMAPQTFPTTRLVTTPGGASPSTPPWSARAPGSPAFDDAAGAAARGVPLGPLPADPWAAAAQAAHERSLRDDSAGDGAVGDGARSGLGAPGADEVRGRVGASHAKPGRGAVERRSAPALPAPGGTRATDEDARAARALAPWPPQSGPQTIIGGDEDLKTAFFLTDSSFGPVPTDAPDAPPTGIRRIASPAAGASAGSIAPGSIAPESIAPGATMAGAMTTGAPTPDAPTPDATTPDATTASPTLPSATKPGATSADAITASATNPALPAPSATLLATTPGASASDATTSLATPGSIAAAASAESVAHPDRSVVTDPPFADPASEPPAVKPIDALLKPGALPGLPLRPEAAPTDAPPWAVGPDADTDPDRVAAPPTIFRRPPDFERSRIFDTDPEPPAETTPAAHVDTFVRPVDADMPPVAIAEPRPARARRRERDDDGGSGAGAIDHFPGARRGRRRARGLGLALSPAAWAGAIALTALLLLQGLIGWRDSIAARAPALAPVVAALAWPFGLSLAPPREIDALTIESFDLQAAGTPNVLQLTAVLRNRSGHVVGYPAMELTLTDSAGALLVRKVIGVDAYVGDPMVVASGLGASSERPLRVALEHSGLQPTGYSVALFYP